MSAEALPIPAAAAAKTAAGADSALLAWRFEGFSFDLLRSELHAADGSPIALRPKAEALLRQFLAHPGRLLSRDELIAAVWRDTVVTDDSLVQCIRELRTALRDDSQRLIRTVPRRGYRLEAAVEPVFDLQAAADSPVPIVDQALPAPSALPPAPSQLSQPPDLLAPSAAQPRSHDPASRRSPPRWRWAALAVSAIVAVAGVATALTWNRSGATAHIDQEIAARNAMAVLPFATATASRDERTFADGLADQIVAQISTRTAMTVVGTSSTAAYGGAAPDLAALASKHKVRYVFTGRVDLSARSANSASTASITTQLVEIDTGNVVWSGRYEPRSGPVAVLQEEVGQQIVSGLGDVFSDLAKLRAERNGGSIDTADGVLLGWQEVSVRQSMATMRRARTRFEDALRQDPDSVVALTGLGAAYLSYWSRLTAAEQADAERAVTRALKVKPNDATALMLSGNLQMNHGRPDLALPIFEKAVRIVPSFPNGHLLTARALLALGRLDQVQAKVDRVIQLGASAPGRVSDAYALAAEAALMRGKDAEAREFARLSIGEGPLNPRPHATLAALDALAGAKEQAASEMATFLKLRPGATMAIYNDVNPPSDSPYRAQRARLLEGLRLAGLPEH